MTSAEEESRREFRTFVVPVILLALVLSTIPYLLGFLQSHGRHYMWLGYNLDDACVYLSWMRQAMHGSLQQHNLFTTDSQPAMLANPLFYTLGVIAGLTHLQPITMFHVSRLVFGAIMLYTGWRLICELLDDRAARRWAMLLLCFGAGFGWIPGLWPSAGGSIFSTPVDTWQPEAITFLSLYLSPLFTFSMWLQIAVMLQLVRSHRQQSMRCAVFAGIGGAVIGLSHTYDIVGIAFTWLAYLAVCTFRNRQAVAGDILRATVAGVITLPGVAVIAWELHTNKVFHDRAAVATLSASPVWVLMGYGLLFILALIPVISVAKSNNHSSNLDDSATQTKPGNQSTDSVLFLVCWATMQIAVAYLPVAFQRKMLQGEHIPIAILAGAGAAWLFGQMTRSTPQFRAVCQTVLLVVCALTNVRFLLRDVKDASADQVQTGQQRPYLTNGELQAIQWIKKNTPATAAIQPLPWVRLITTPSGAEKIAPTDMSDACFLPGMTDRHVYCGHWGETPDYGGKLARIVRFALPTTTDAHRIAMLRRMRVQYIVFTQKDPGDTSAPQLAPMFCGLIPVPAYLQRVYGNARADVYRVNLSP